VPGLIRVSTLHGVGQGTKALAHFFQSIDYRLHTRALLSEASYDCAQTADGCNWFRPRLSVPQRGQVKPQLAIADHFGLGGLGSRYQSGRSLLWVKSRNPNAPAIKRLTEEEWN
jgi:hypothetical protein